MPKSTPRPVLPRSPLGASLVFSTSPLNHKVVGRRTLHKPSKSRKTSGASRSLVRSLVRTRKHPMVFTWRSRFAGVKASPSPRGRCRTSRPPVRGRRPELETLEDRRLLAVSVLDLSATSRQWLAQVYRDLLHRAADPAGLTTWGGMLDQGTSRAQVARGIWESSEHRGLQVDAFYATSFHRAADPTGRDLWVKALLDGRSETEVARSFLTSQEYTASHPDTVSFLSG